ncbi:PT domain-containing protein, partial [Candidatus Babeliales bacterium]|nr:PT domain-containing protein [Candidatus Babeliales bacterium]
TGTILNDTNFNISTAALPIHTNHFVWFVMCVDNNTVANIANSSVLTFSVLTTPFLTSVLSSPIDGSAQTVASTISLTGSCESNATLTGGRFWVYRSTGVDYANYANTSAITNATAFSASFTVPIEATTWYWNLECFDNHYQNANATANFSFTAASGTSSGSSGTGCTVNSDCSSGYYCTSSVCVECNIAADGICRTCAAELGLTDPDCEEEAAPTAQPTAAPTQEPTQEPTIAPTQEPATEPTAEPTQAPVEDGVTYEEAIAEIEEAQSMQGASTNEEAQALIDLAMAALEDGEFEQAKAYAQQAQTLLLSTSVPEEEVQAGFDWTLPILLLLAVVGAIVYFSTKKKEGL